MKPVAFDYLRPRSIDEAIASLRAGQGGAKLLAGGIVQDLIARLANEFARRLEHSLAADAKEPLPETPLNPAGLLWPVMTARVRGAFARLFRRRSI